MCRPKQSFADTEKQNINFSGAGVGGDGFRKSSENDIWSNSFLPKSPCFLVLPVNALGFFFFNRFVCFSFFWVSFSLTFFHLEEMEIYEFLKHTSRQSNESLGKDLFLHSDLKICYLPTRNSNYINSKKERLLTINETLSFHSPGKWTRMTKGKLLQFWEESQLNLLV